MRSWRLVPTLVAGFCLLVSLSWAETSEAKTTCSVKPIPNGFKYQLDIKPPQPSRGEMSWESEDHTSLARGLRFDEKEVVNATVDSITLKECKSYMRANWDNAGVREEVRCEVNCTALMMPTVIPAGNSSMVCLPKSYCVQEWKIGVFTGVVVLIIAAIIGALLLWKRKVRGRPASQTTSYSPANDESKLGYHP